uniref:General transcription factor TFIIB n=1 Tax=Adiantum capillus-veneris TaxID=13818 RepID=A0A9D4ZBD7_ADICA|nr:hypothetical protein GOP47_0018200 [Adiantum capillus-veneris]
MRESRMEAGDKDDECQNCGVRGKTVWDMTSGDYVCTACGAVLQDHAVDPRPEWRNNMEEEGGQDHSRVGDATDPFRDGNVDYFQAGTVIAAPTSSARHRPGAANASDSYEALRSTAAKVPSEKPQKRLRNLDDHLSNIATVAESLQLAPRLSQRAQDLFTCGMQSVPSFRRVGKNGEVFYAGCIYLACTEENTHHNIDDIVAAAGLQKKDVPEVNKVKKAVKKHVDELPESSPYKPRPTGRSGVTQNELDRERFVRSFGNALNFSPKAIKIALEIATNAQEKMDSGRNLKSACAGVILMVALLVEKEREFEVSDVVEATGTSLDTLKKTYKDLHNHSDFIVPDEVTIEYGALASPSILTNKRHKRSKA